MYLTIGKRFEFSASHRCHRSDWSDERNRMVFGREAEGKYGHGHNYRVSFVFHGPVDPSTGMMINVVDIKKLISPLLDNHFDHKYLNVDTRPFDSIVPTAENLAHQLLKDVQPLFAREQAHPVACHLIESPTSEATAYADGRVERHCWLQFSAARRTYSPHLTDEENERLFGIAAAPSGHGHNYRLRVTLGGKLNPEYGLIVTDQVQQEALGSLHAELDHRNLNSDVPALSGLPTTTETLARFIWQRLESDLPVRSVRLYETDDFFVEYRGEDNFGMAVVNGFNAAHRLHSPHLSEQENIHLYGKCNNPRGHGHLYQVECVINGPLEERSGTVFSLEEFNHGVASVLDRWNYKHLNLETEDFDNQTSTGENIVQVLWNRMSATLGRPLYRLRLWETPNNRFTLRNDTK